VIERVEGQYGRTGWAITQRAFRSPPPLLERCALTRCQQSTTTTEVGWRERDYARFTKQEWDAYTGPSAPGASRSGRPSSSRRHAVGTPLLAAVAVSAAATAFFGWGPITSYLHSPAPHISSPALISTPRLPATPARSKVIGIRWRTTDLAPAGQAGRICVTDPSHGRICASYVVGERPADTLTRRIESLGLRVESNG
jgi:hypothetical protein